MAGASPARAYRRAEGLARRRVADEVVVLDPRRQWIFGFNLTAGAVLEALERPLGVDRLAAALAPAPDHEAARAELEVFLAELLAEGLVEPAAETEVAGDLAVTAPWTPPRRLWREEVVQVTHQASPPQAITNPQCIP